MDREGKTSAEGQRPKRDLRTRRDAAQKERRLTGPRVKKVERKIQLSQRASLILDCYQLGSGKGLSEILEELVLTHCDVYEIRHKEGRDKAGTDGAGEGANTSRP